MVYVIIAQGISGIAKDLTKVSAKSAIKTVVSDENKNRRLFKLVSLSRSRCIKTDKTSKTYSIKRSANESIRYIQAIVLQEYGLIYKDTPLYNLCITPDE